jgi:hypothetical protein
MKVCKTYSKIVQNGSIFSKRSHIVWKMNEPEYYNRQKAAWDENELKDIIDEYEKIQDYNANVLFVNLTLR